MPASSIPSDQSPLAGVAWRPILAALLVTALVTALRMPGDVAGDVAWQLWIAGQLHAGAQLYRDIVEVNPPLWFWMAMPVDRAAALLDVRPQAMLAVAIGIATALSLAATDRLIRHLPPVRRTLLLSYAALLLTGAPWTHLGQREQILLIGTLPYVALAAARRSGLAVQTPLAILIGIGAALGFALKHYFLLIPALLELWLFAGSRTNWRWRRPELGAIVLTGAAYACAVLVVTPEFLTKVVPLVRLAYGDVGAPGLALLFGPSLIVGVASLALAAAEARKANRTPLTSALVVASTAAAAIYFVQAKGWSYQAIPLLGCASLALAALLAETAAPSAAMRLFAPALLVLPFGIAFQETHAPFAVEKDLRSAIAGLGAGDPVGFIATDNVIAWSVTLQHGFRYPSRYMNYWMLRAIVANEHRQDPDRRLVRLGRQIIADTVDDYRCLPPKRIIVARPRPGEGGFDILAFFGRDPRFAELLAHYRVRSRTSIEALDLASPLPPPSTHCRAVF